MALDPAPEQEPPIGILPEEPKPIAKQPEDEAGVSLEDQDPLPCQRVRLRGWQTTKVVQANFLQAVRELTGKLPRGNFTDEQGESLFNLQGPINLRGQRVKNVQVSEEPFSAVPLSKIQELLNN